MAVNGSLKGALLDRFGNPVQRAALTREVAAATLGGVRTPLPGYPGDGLNPQRLASILREADAGDPVRYMELAETIEERDLHYVGVLGTRRRAVAQLDITVEPASDDAADVDRADTIREWLDRGELEDELFDILDAIGKGYSATEIIWDTSAGEWMPTRLEWRDPRWFRPDRTDLTTLRKLDDAGQTVPMDPFKFIMATIKSKSGLPIRGGIARPAAWAWMFKAYTQRDWAIFTQTYGQPLRVGKFGPGASEADKDTLFRAVANIAGDCAAIIPESMTIDFVETSSAGTTSQLYRERADWLDQQVSKAVLGQTGTTDAIAGGFAGNKVHRQVQEDIERSDAKALATALRRDLIIPWMQLNFGPLPAYPKLKIGRPEQRDLAALSQALGPMIDRGLKVSQASLRDMFGVEEPEDGVDLMRPIGAAHPATEGETRPPAAPGTPPAPPAPPLSGQSGDFKRGEADPGPAPALQSEGASSGENSGGSPAEVLADRIGDALQPDIGEMLERVEIMIAAAGSLDEVRAMLAAAYPQLGADRLGETLAQALIAGHLGGRAAAEG